MKDALRLYYGHILPVLWKDRRLRLIVVFWFVFHFGPLAARSTSDPWDHPLIYANF